MKKREKPRSDPRTRFLTKSNQETLQKWCFLIAGQPSEQVCDQGLAWFGRNLQENNKKSSSEALVLGTVKNTKNSTKHQK